ASGHYEFTTPFESSKYKIGGANDQISNDGGALATAYEKGSKLGLIPVDYGDTSLVGYWTFDEGTGTIAYDYSGNNATGSLQNNPTWTPTCKTGGCLSFDGSSTFVQVPDTSSTELATQDTLAA